MIRLLYSFALALATPWLLLHLLLRSRRQPEYRRHWGERFGLYEGPPNTGPLIWVHAVSVGETRAAQTLIAELQARFPDHAVLLTHMTPTGRETSEQIFGDRVGRCYLPYDYRFAVRRFLRHFQPSLGILMETEVWPNLIAESKKLDIRVALINARLSAKSFEKAARFGALIGPALRNLRIVLAQTVQDAERLQHAGVRYPRVTGNLKFDVAPPPEQIALGETFRQRIGERPVLLAASTREGEEELLLSALTAGSNSGLNLGSNLGAKPRSGRGAYSDASRMPPGTLLVVVPRHPQRFDDVARLLAGSGLSVQRRSDGEPVKPETQVWLGDSMGEMFAYYSAASVAFIGGSLLPLGGQNLIEACAVGCPVLIGPHTFNFTQVTEDAIAAGAALRVADADGLIAAAAELLREPSRRRNMADRAIRFIAVHRGATQRTIKALAPLLERARRGRTALEKRGGR